MGEKSCRCPVAALVLDIQKLILRMWKQVVPHDRCKFMTNDMSFRNMLMDDGSTLDMLPVDFDVVSQQFEDLQQMMLARETIW